MKDRPINKELNWSYSGTPYAGRQYWHFYRSTEFCTGSFTKAKYG